MPDTEEHVGRVQIPEAARQLDGCQVDDWVDVFNQPGESAITPAVPEALSHFRTMLSTGAPWRHALLETMGRWTLTEEIINGRQYRYLLMGEAFDWLLLAERLCSDVNGTIPIEEAERLLFSNKIPETVDENQFRDYLGPSKYRAYMNYRYGVTLEEVLQLVAEEETQKHHMSRSLSATDDLTEESFGRLYGRPKSQLLKMFQKETKKDRRRKLSLSDLKEFTYWLHKRRINLWDPARVASDTRKAIRRLEMLEHDHNVPTSSA